MACESIRAGANQRERLAATPCNISITENAVIHSLPNDSDATTTEACNACCWHVCKTTKMHWLISAWVWNAGLQGLHGKCDRAHGRLVMLSDAVA